MNATDTVAAPPSRLPHAAPDGLIAAVLLSFLATAGSSM